MSFLTSLALMLTPLARRSLIPVKSRESKLEARIAELERELSEARADAAHWETLTHRWQARCIFEQETRVQIRQQRTQMMHAMARYQAAHAQAFCNCVPARHDAFLGGVNHA